MLGNCFRLLNQIPNIISFENVLIMDSGLMMSGVERDYMELTPEELEMVRKAILPAFKTDYYDEDKFKWLFRLFKIYYQREYDSGEEETKYQIFSKNLKLMNEINSQKKSFSVRINKFADQEEITMPPGLMKSLHDEQMNKSNNISKFLNGEYKGTFKFDSQINNELRRKTEDKSKPKMLKGPVEGLNEFAIKTEDLTDPNQNSLEESKIAFNVNNRWIYLKFIQIIRTI